MAYDWRETFQETLIQAQERIPGGRPVIAADGIRVLSEHIGKAVANGLLRSNAEVRFVTAVETLRAIAIAKEQHASKVDRFIIEEALRRNHLPGEPPWKCVTSIIRKKADLLRERDLEGLDRFDPDQSEPGEAEVAGQPPEYR